MIVRADGSAIVGNLGWVSHVRDGRLRPLDPYPFVDIDTPLAMDPHNPNAVLMTGPARAGADGTVLSFDTSTGDVTVQSDGWAFEEAHTSIPLAGYPYAYEPNLLGIADLDADVAGRAYIASGAMQSVWRVDPTGGIIRLLAGKPRNWLLPLEQSGDGGPATEATLTLELPPSGPRKGGIHVDGDWLYIADPAQHVVRRVDLVTGIIERFAGVPRWDDRMETEPGPSGDGGDALEAELHYPHDITTGPDGELYIAEDQGCVRVVDPDGTIRTFAGICGEHGYDGDGGPPEEAHLESAWCVETDKVGNVYVCDPDAGVIRVVLR
jgi:sugar lactone lactonase YvrE